MTEESSKPVARRGRPKKVAEGGFVERNVNTEVDTVPATITSDYVIPQKEISKVDIPGLEDSSFNDYEVTILDYGITFGSRLPGPGEILIVSKKDMSPRSEEHQLKKYGRVIYTYKEV